MNDYKIRQALLKINSDFIETRDYNIDSWILEWISENYIEPTQEELEIAWVEVDKQNKIDQYNKEFDDAIEEYENIILFDNKKTPKHKKKKMQYISKLAQDVLNWWNSVYIQARAENKWIQKEEFAQYIKDKTDAFEQFYADKEIELENKIKALG